MRWAWFGAVVVGSLLACAAYACNSDSFVPVDAGDDAAPPVTQADFCDAETAFLAHCQVDAACALANLNQCGSFFAALNPSLARAIVHCVDKQQLECTSDFLSQISSSCMQTEIGADPNDGGALAKLVADLCSACDPSPTCADKVAATPDQPAYLPSLFSDPVIQTIDTSCALKLDGGALTVGDASLTCAQQFTLCSYVVIGSALPKDACQDGGF